MTEYRTTIRELGEDPADWYASGGDAIEEYGGYTDFDERYAVVNVDEPCRVVTDIVCHEWMHLQQVRLHGDGDGVRRAYGGRMEMVADCGSRLLGSAYTPYVDMARGCSPRDLADARKLIAYSDGAL